jgi:hypothetical protein
MRFTFPAALAGTLFLSLPVFAGNTLPLWATTPSATMDGEAQARFATALARRGLPAPLRVEIPQPAAPPAPALYRTALTLSPATPTDAVAAAFTQAANAALGTGGAGLSHDELIDLFFRQAVAIQKNAGPPPGKSLTTIEPEAARVAYLRAVVFGLSQTPPAYAGDPTVEASLALARTWVAARKPASLAVQARPNAKVFIDNLPLPYPAKATNLRMGDHLVRVEELGRAPFSALVPLNEPEVGLATPAMEVLRFPAPNAAKLAREANARFALLGQLRLGDAAEVDLWLIDAATGVLRTASALPWDGDEPAYFAAVLRLDEEATKAHLEKNGSNGVLSPLAMTLPPAKSPEKPAFHENPEGWAAAHWPLLTAVGVAVGSALVLGIVVATDKDSTVKQ